VGNAYTHAPRVSNRNTGVVRNIHAHVLTVAVSMWIMELNHDNYKPMAVDVIVCVALDVDTET
jgi:hypothetical protein